MTTTFPLGIQLVLAGNMALLVLATGVIASLRHRAVAEYSELAGRIRSWWLIFVVFATTLLVHRIALVIFMGLVSFLALKEYLSIIPTRKVDRRLLLIVYAIIPAQFLWVGLAWYEPFVAFIPVVSMMIVQAGMIIGGETRRFHQAASTLQWGLITTVYSLSHVAYLTSLPASEPRSANSAGLVLFLVLLTELNDVAQYLWGKLIKGPRLAPSVSPNKTWSGLLGGLLTTIILSLAISSLLTPFSAAEALAAGILIGIGGSLGDIVISAMKRDLDIKDTGKALAGHGGVLDRVDSLTVSAPLFFYFTLYVMQ